MEAELESVVRSIISENKKRRAEWSAELGEITSALVSGEDIPNSRLEEILDGVNTDGGSEGDSSGSNG